MASEAKIKRITVKYKQPNPLFEKWIEEWYDEAKTRDSKMQHVFRSALSTLKKYPLPIDSGKECIILKGFGKKLCDMLDKKLTEYRTTGDICTNNIVNQKGIDTNDNSSNVEIVKEDTNIRNNEQRTLTSENNALHNENVQTNTVETNLNNVEILDEVIVKDSTSNILQNEEEVNRMKRSSRSSKTSNVYKPMRGSGAYAILLVLYTNSRKANYKGYMTKAEIIEEAKEFCEKSYYTAWSSMITLIKKELVSRSSCPVKFSLTQQGVRVGMELMGKDETETVQLTSETMERISPNDKNVNTLSSVDKIPINVSPISNNINISPTDKNLKKISPVNRNISSMLPTDKNVELHNTAQCSSENCTQFSSISKASTTSILPLSDCISTQSSNSETVIFLPYTFDIILLVDKQETAGNSQKLLDDETIYELSKLSILFEVRHLKVGDFTWICRERKSQKELVLPYIVERKRIDDLGHSIKDGRFHEQKFRLKGCGLDNVIYVVENFRHNSHTVLPLTSLIQAATNTLVQDKFQVKFTQNHRHSMQYLSGITKVLTSIYEKKTLVSSSKEDLVKHSVSDDLVLLMPFNEFNKGASKAKKMRVRDVFARQILQLKGVSVEKALAIIDKYPTPKLLKDAYDKMGSASEKLLANIQYGPVKRAIGPAISTTIYQLYNREKLC